MLAWKRWSVLAVLTLTVVMLAVDATVLALAVPALTADLAPTATQILWIGDIYSLAIAGLLIPMGNLADRVGRRTLLLWGCVGFGAGSVLAAFAPTAEWLIAARAVMGVAGATLMPSTLAIVRDVFRDRAERTRAIAVWSAGGMAGAALGPLVGGVLLEFFPWGSVFLINVPLVLMIVVAGMLLIPESRDPKRRPIDGVSVVLSLLAIVPPVYAIKHAVSHGLTVEVVVCTAVGAAAGILFVRRQRRVPHPLIDVRLFRNPAFSGAVASTGLSVFAFIGVLFFISQYLQLVRGLSPLQAGLVELPSVLASIAVVALVGVLSRRWGQGRAIAAGLLGAGVGLVGLAVSEGLPHVVGLAAALVVVGFGAGLAMTLATDAVVGAAPRSRAGAASSISETGYELGVALGIAVLGSIQTALYRHNLPALDGVDPALAAPVTESLAEASPLLQDGQSALLDAAQHAFTVSMQTTALIAAAVMLVAAIVAWRIIPAAPALAPAEHSDTGVIEQPLQNA